MRESDARRPNIRLRKETESGKEECERGQRDGEEKWGVKIEFLSRVSALTDFASPCLLPLRPKDRCGSQPASLNQAQERRRPLKAHQSESFLPLGEQESHNGHRDNNTLCSQSIS